MPSFTPPLSVAEASEQSGEPRRTIRYAISAGHLKAHKMPGATGAYLIAPSELRRWIAKRAA
jgi:excisionase family DNA binding protein